MFGMLVPLGMRSKESTGIRHDKVAAARAAIAKGNYETDLKIAGAINNLLVVLNHSDAEEQPPIRPQFQFEKLESRN